VSSPGARAVPETRYTLNETSAVVGPEINRTMHCMALGASESDWCWQHKSNSSTSPAMTAASIKFRFEALTATCKCRGC